MANEYWIESIKEVDSPDSESLIAIISCSEHGACIEVYGTKHKLTDRVMAVLNGLNKTEAKK